MRCRARGEKNINAAMPTTARATTPPIIPPTTSSSLVCNLDGEDAGVMVGVHDGVDVGDGVCELDERINAKMVVPSLAVTYTVPSGPSIGEDGPATSEVELQLVEPSLPLIEKMCSTHPA